MRIGIDISQIVYSQTGVANYLRNLVKNLLKVDQGNEYVLFFSSMRKNLPCSIYRLLSENKNVKIRTFKFPPTLLDLLWNRLHIVPIEWFIGNVDIFLSSDWTQPPTKKAKKVTILYDLLVYKYPQEMHGKIVSVQKRRLAWIKKECNEIICISKATKKDAMAILGIEENRLKVVYPGV